MTIYFADSSAVAKRYITEIGSAWVRNQFEAASGNVLIVSDIAAVDVRKVFIQYQLDHKLTVRNAVLLRRAFQYHFDNEYIVVGVDFTLLEQASELTRKHALVRRSMLRSLDSIQLACAIQASRNLTSDVIFLSSDKRLLAAAVAEGYITDNPENYP